MVFSSGNSKRRVLPLQVDTATSDPVVQPTATQRSSLPPKSPLHGARTRNTDGSQSTVDYGGLDRMLLLRNMNVAGTISGVDEPSMPTVLGRSRPQTKVVSTGGEEVSAARNLKERKEAEARRRAEVQLMALEDYINTPEGEARLQRQDERARMQEEELRMQRVLQHEKALRRAEQLKKQQEEENRIKEMYLAKRKQEQEERDRVAREKEAARKQALEAKMKALKEEADRKAREEYAARQRILAEAAQAEQDVRTAALESALMQVEDACGSAMRAEWLAEVERRKQIEEEAKEWAKFEEMEAQRQREETQRRREAQREQYEQDRARRMQIHKLHQDRERAAAEKKRQAEVPDDIPAPALPPVNLQRLRSRAESLVPIIHPASDQADEASTLQSVMTARSRRVTEIIPVTTARPPTSLGGIIEIPVEIPPPPSHLPPDLAETSTNSQATVSQDESSTVTKPVSPPKSVSIPLTDTVVADDADVQKPVEEVGANVDSSPRAVECSTPPTEAVWLSLSKYRESGVSPIAEVLSVNDGSPAMVAGLAPHDLLIDVNGITNSTPKCLVAIAQCIQANVNQRLPLILLRREQPDDGLCDRVQRYELSLIPCKWKGKGLLGCQLSPFKWPEILNANPTEPQMTASVTEDPVPSSPSEPLVVYQIESQSIAFRVGLMEGDVLAKCGDLEVSMHARGDPRVVADFLQRNWRDAHQEVPLVIQRWNAEEQDYNVLQMSLPPPAVNEQLGCSLTTYAEYYAQPAVTVCDECYYSTLTSSLHAAVLSEHSTCLQALLVSENSADLLDWRDEEGRSPLFYACYAMKVESVWWLLAYLQTTSYDPVAGADSYGDSPLHAAALNGCVEAVRLLLETRYINDVNLTNPITQATPAHVAASDTILRVLKDEFNADLLAVDSDGRMPLFYACTRNDVASVAYLCELHRDFVDYADSAGGNTPLHMAAWYGYTDVVATLVKSLPSIALYITNQDGLDPRSLAQLSGWTEIVKLLDRYMLDESSDDTSS